MEGHPVDPETGEVLAEEPFTEPFPEAEIVAPATPEIYLPDQEWPEEPEAYEEFPEAEEFEDDGKKFKWISHLRNSSSTSFQRLISSHLTSRKINPKRKHRSSEYPHFGRNLCKL